METANISGSIRINLTPEYAREIGWGRPLFVKRGGQESKDVPLITKLKDTHGVSGVYFTNDKNGELIATIRVQNPNEGKDILTTIVKYPGVMAAQISLGPAGPPPASPPPKPS